MTNLLELLNIARTKIECGRLGEARIALSNYWTNRCQGNGSPSTDDEARVIMAELFHLHVANCARYNPIRQAA